MSPGYIISLLQIHAFPHPEVSKGFVQDLLDDEMIYEFPPEDEYEYRFRVTAKGKKFVEMLEQTQLPVQVWIDPRSIETEEESRMNTGWRKIAQACSDSRK